HLHQSALDLAVEVGVLLDAVDEDNTVRSRRVAVQVDRQAVVGRADLIDLHRRVDRAADERLGHPERRQDLDLALGRRAPVATHCWNDEWLSADPPNRLDRPAGDARDVGDAATSDRDGDPLSLTDP